jgi:hypothetical protein
MKSLKSVTGMFDPMVQTYDPFDDRAMFTLQYCLWPRRCYLTGKWLFMTECTRGRRIIMGPGTDVIEDRWYDQKEYTMMILKKV